MPDGADAYAVPTRIVSDSARRAVRYQALALWLVSGLALAAAAVVAAQVVARALHLGNDEHAAMVAMGSRRRDLVVERAVEGALIGLVALPVAALVGYLGTTPSAWDPCVVRTRSGAAPRPRRARRRPAGPGGGRGRGRCLRPAGGASRPLGLGRRGSGVSRARRRRDAARRRAPLRHVERRRPAALGGGRDSARWESPGCGRSHGRLGTDDRRRHPGALGRQLRLDVRQPLRPGAGRPRHAPAGRRRRRRRHGRQHRVSHHRRLRRRRSRSPPRRATSCRPCSRGGCRGPTTRSGSAAEVARRVGVEVGDHVEVRGSRATRSGCSWWASSSCPTPPATGRP